jgi:hypothetical protein
VSRLWGIWGRPYVDLEGLIDTGRFAELDDEITRGLCQVESAPTGGTLKWMGVVAPWAMADGYTDAMHAIERFSREEYARFVALADEPAAFDLDRQADTTFGDETEHPFTRAQATFLRVRHGVYFPWKVCYHLLENDRWDDKHSGAGKSFGEEATRVFPKTVAFVRSLPMTQIGRCVIFGLEANDHAPAHRDSQPGEALSIAQSISFDPRGTKRFYLTDPDHEREVVVGARVYWFNDMDYHGVLPDPFFRYSVRVDGVFDPAFVRKLQVASVSGRTF